MKRRYVLLALTSILAVALTVPALGGPGNPIATGAASAKKTAKKALKKAKKANQNAKAAQLTADEAAAAAANAQSTADGAQSTADGAQSAAEAAQTSADAAQASADNAQATADAALNDTDFESGETSASDSSTPKVVSAGCIADYDPTGGGFVMNGAGANDVTVTLSQSYGTGWLVQGREIGAGTADDWSITANVNCVGSP